MLIIGILLFGLLVGAAAQLVLGRDGRGIDWGMALVAGLPARSSVGCSPACSPVTASTSARAD